MIVIIMVYFAATLLGFISNAIFYKDVAATLHVFILLLLSTKILPLRGLLFTINNAFYKDVTAMRFVLTINNAFYKVVTATRFAL